MVTLRDLTAWEHRLLEEIERQGGTLEERDAAFTRAGLYAEYAALFGSYVDLAEAAPAVSDQLEALKRAVFLLWYEGTEPPQLSGVTELPAGAVQHALRLLEARCAGHRLDAEERWMLPWYYSVASYALLRMPGLDCLERLLHKADPHSWQLESLDPAGFRERGAMGRYWLSLRRAA